MLTLEKGRPASTDGRQEKEIAVYDFLDKLSVSYERVDHEPAFTMEACEEIDALLSPAAHCKNLFLCNAQKTDFYLLMIRADKKFRTKEISSQIGSSRLSFGPEEYLLEFLNITPGAVSVMGLMNDKAHRVRLLIDRDLLAQDAVGVHPCVNTASLRISVSDLTEKFLPAVDHGFLPVVLTADTI
ncbi:MAG: prolyl-tRNA synthetase associated domain-containing protein [Clostridia bacterium]|nr:prolyl-tRNA synthetase associated domain-containing protein [Clostridia bacterium]